MKLRSLGQSGFIMTMRNGTVVMTDPWLSPSLLKGYTTPVDHRDIERCDVILVSHAHIDHLDPGAFRLAKRLGSVFVGSRKAVGKAVKRGVANAIEMAGGEEAEVAGVKIHAVPAFHPFASDAVGFVVEGEKTVYFSGDTRYNEKLVRHLEKFRLDVALLQIACSVYFFRKDGMDVGDASELARRIKPGVAVPMHYHDRFRHPDPERFRALVTGYGIHVDIFEPGEEKEY
ncbi:MAG: MBL fold metallo-hydrolase [bacterium]